MRVVVLVKDHQMSYKCSGKGSLYLLIMFSFSQGTGPQLDFAEASSTSREAALHADDFKSLLLVYGHAGKFMLAGKILSQA